MGFLKRLFGGKKEPYVDKRGIYLYITCDNCGSRLRMRIDKEYDLNRENGGYVWNKTVVDSKCFRPMPTVVHFDSNYNVVEAEIDGGHYLSKEEYEAPGSASPADEATDAETEEGPDSTSLQSGA